MTSNKPPHEHLSTEQTRVLAVQILNDGLQNHQPDMVVICEDCRKTIIEVMKTINSSDLEDTTQTLRAIRSNGWQFIANSLTEVKARQATQLETDAEIYRKGLPALETLGYPNPRRQDVFSLHRKLRNEYYTTSRSIPIVNKNGTPKDLEDCVNRALVLSDAINYLTHVHSHYQYILE